MEIKLKAIGKRHGTVGWLKNALESGELKLEESNRFYVPVWADEWSGENVLTHGLVLSDKSGKSSALVAWRDTSGEYRYNVSAALANDEMAHWSLNLTDAAKQALRDICEAWIDTQEDDTQEDITVTIKRA